MTFGLCAGAGRVQAGEVAASAGVRASDFRACVPGADQTRGRVSTALTLTSSPSK